MRESGRAIGGEGRRGKAKWTEKGEKKKEGEEGKPQGKGQVKGYSRIVEGKGRGRRRRKSLWVSGK